MASASLLIYVQFLILTLHGKVAENDSSCLLPFSAVSHLSEQFFSCGHPHEYFNCIALSLFLQCKLEQQACLTGKDLSIKCTGFCPCATASITDTNTDTKRGKCLFTHLSFWIHSTISASQDSNLIYWFGSILTNSRDYCCPNIPHMVKLLFQLCGN